MIVTLAEVQRAVSEDLATGEAKALPLLLRIADHAYKGNLVTERLSDWVLSHTGADAYRDLVRMVHAALLDKTLTLED